MCWKCVCYCCVIFCSCCCCSCNNFPCSCFSILDFLCNPWCSHCSGFRIRICSCYYHCHLLFIPCWICFSGFRISSCTCGQIFILKPKSTALKCMQKDSLILCAPPLLTVALPSLHEEIEMCENALLNTHSSSLLSSFQFFFKELIWIRGAFPV